MKYILGNFLVAIAALLCSCTNNTGNNIAKKSASQQAVPVAGDVENFITFKVNNIPVATSGWNISRSMMDGAIVLNVTSNMHQEERTINININGDKKGKYSFLNMGAYNKTGFAYGSFFYNYKEDLINPYHFEDGQFIITSIDTLKGVLDAEFSGTVKNNNGDRLTITEGKVKKGKLKPGVTSF